MQNCLKAAFLSSVVVLFGALTGAQDSIGPNKLESDEREALIALYNATSGPQWTKKSGWLGPSGTECEWYGVSCDHSAHTKTGIPIVVALDLSSNNLNGAIPVELGRLKDLGWLSLFDNHLTGTLPDTLLQRWLAGPLEIIAEAHLLTTFSQIDYESNASSLLCARRRVIFSSDGKGVTYTTRCSTREGRNTYCEVKKGQIRWDEFARLAWNIEKAGFFALRPEYSRNITDAGFENTRVTRDGKRVQVSNYAGAGPLELWGIQRAIEGIASNMEAEKTTRLASCPRW
jgi:Leucine Rich Repeat (LRR) protein